MSNSLILRNSVNSRKFTFFKKFTKIQENNKLNVKGSTKTCWSCSGEGQGNCVSGRRISLCLAEITTRHSEKIPEELVYKHRQQQIKNTGFVDDAALYGKNAEGAKLNGKIYSEILNEMALDAHPTKTVQVVIGHKRSIEKLKDDIKLDPTKVQGHNIEIKKEEKYLGQFVPEGGKKQYIERNIEAKMARIIVTSNEIRNILRHPIMSRFGKVLAQKTLIVSQIIPLITYGCQSWLYPNKGQIKMLEKILTKNL